MGLLSDALPQKPSGIVVKSEIGPHNGAFVGISAPYDVVNKFNKCRACKGSGEYSGEECFACHGERHQVDKKAVMRYELDDGNVEEEEVNFKLTAPGKGKDGTPLSPSTMFVRFRSMSGIQTPTPEQLDEWYTNLPEPKRVPCSVVIGENDEGTKRKIIAVNRPRGGQQRTDGDLLREAEQKLRELPSTVAEAKSRQHVSGKREEIAARARENAAKAEPAKPVPVQRDISKLSEMQAKHEVNNPPYDGEDLWEGLVEDDR